MSTRRRQTPGHKGYDPRAGVLPPVRKLEVRRRELFAEESEADAFEFVEEYDAAGGRLRVERFHR